MASDRFCTAREHKYLYLLPHCSQKQTSTLYLNFSKHLYQILGPVETWMDIFAPYLITEMWYQFKTLEKGKHLEFPFETRSFLVTLSALCSHDLESRYSISLISPGGLFIIQ